MTDTDPGVIRKRIRAIVAGLLILLLLWAFLQALLVPKYMTENREGALIREYYDEPTDHDVLFVGDCEVYESFVPPVLWEEAGITSYVRGSAQQLIWQSYYLMKEMLERESPEVVVFNVLSVKYGEPQKEAYNRMTLDGMRWSKNKIRAIRTSMTEEENFLSYVFPILRYHDRWQDLKGEDIRCLFRRDRVSFGGYLMQTGIVPKTSEREGEALFDYTLPQIGFDYLEKMAALCEEHGATLLLIKAPTNSWKYWWYDEWDAQISDFAVAHGLDYLNMIGYEDEIGLDWSTDSYDGGVHLNVYGAEKLSRWFAAKLVNEYGITDRRGDAALAKEWDSLAERYHEELEKMQNEVQK